MVAREVPKPLHGLTGGKGSGADLIEQTAQVDDVHGRVAMGRSIRSVSTSFMLPERNPSKSSAT